MSKVETLERLEASAIELFSRHGYNGTSLRDIAKHADVALSTIDRHYGSKEALFNEIQRGIWSDLDAEREELLRKSIVAAGGGKPTIDALLHAFMHPVVSRVTKGDGDNREMRLVREMQTARLHMGFTCGPEPVAEVQRRWLARLLAAYPALRDEQPVWLMAFMVSITYCSHLIDGWYDHLLTGDRRRSPETITRTMVAFCRGGIQAIVEEDACSRSTQ
jgi:AcrR family transcriptional regulator